MQTGGWARQQNGTCRLTFFLHTILMCNIAVEVMPIATREFHVSGHPNLVFDADTALEMAGVNMRLEKGAIR